MPLCCRNCMILVFLGLIVRPIASAFTTMFESFLLRSESRKGTWYHPLKLLHSPCLAFPPARWVVYPDKAWKSKWKYDSLVVFPCWPWTYFLLCWWSSMSTEVESAAEYFFDLVYLSDSWRMFTCVTELNAFLKSMKAQWRNWGLAPFLVLRISCIRWCVVYPLEINPTCVLQIKLALVSRC